MEKSKGTLIRMESVVGCWVLGVGINEIETVLWLQVERHCEHSAQKPHLRQRFASSMACSRDSPNSISLKLLLV